MGQDLPTGCEGKGRVASEVPGHSRGKGGRQGERGDWGSARSMPVRTPVRYPSGDAQDRTGHASRLSVVVTEERRVGGEDVAIGGGDLGPSGFQRSRL